MPADRADLPPLTPKVHLEVYEVVMLPRDDPLKKGVESYHRQLGPGMTYTQMVTPTPKPGRKDH